MNYEEVLTPVLALNDLICGPLLYLHLFQYSHPLFIFPQGWPKLIMRH